MSASPIDKELNRLWPKLTITQKESIMQVMKAFAGEAEKIIPSLGVSISEYNKELKEAEASIDRGKFYTQEQVKEMFKKWDRSHTKSTGAKKR